VAVIIDTSDDDNNDTDDNIVETSDESSDAAEAQDTANVTNKLCFILGAKDSLMLMILILVCITIMNKYFCTRCPTIINWLLIPVVLNRHWGYKAAFEQGTLFLNIKLQLINARYLIVQTKVCGNSPNWCLNGKVSWAK